MQIHLNKQSCLDDSSIDVQSPPRAQIKIWRGRYIDSWPQTAHKGFIMTCNKPRTIYIVDHLLKARVFKV